MEPKCEGEREAGCCNENEITGTTRCQDGNKDRVEVREKDAHKQMGEEEEEEGSSSCCCEEETALFTTWSLTESISLNCLMCEVYP